MPQLYPRPQDTVGFGSRNSSGLWSLAMPNQGWDQRRMFSLSPYKLHQSMTRMRCLMCLWFCAGSMWVSSGCRGLRVGTKGLVDFYEIIRFLGINDFEATPLILNQSVFLINLHRLGLKQFNNLLLDSLYSAAFYPHANGSKPGTPSICWLQNHLFLMSKITISRCQRNRTIFPHVDPHLVPLDVACRTVMGCQVPWRHGLAAQVGSQELGVNCD